MSLGSSLVRVVRVYPVEPMQTQALSLEKAVEAIGSDRIGGTTYVQMCMGIEMMAQMRICARAITRRSTLRTS